MTDTGVYIHVPFCASKCPYCDFYSVRFNEAQEKIYMKALFSQMQKYGGIGIDTVYFGGGTPSLLGAEKITEILNEVKKIFILHTPEITVECNPSTVDENFFEAIAKAGVNRISLGLQSAVDSERKKLGRKAGRKDVENAITFAKKYGIKNISLDLMLGIENQTEESLKQSVDFCISSDVTHISAYILKLEEGTFFYKNRDKLNLPDEDATCDLYLQACELLENGGFYQYEISNFAKLGYESKHNLKYWNCEEYLGFGPAAHSFYNGKRFYFDREIVENPMPQEDGAGGDFNEYLMLKLRLTKGIENEEVIKKFGHPIPDKIIKKAAFFERKGFMKTDENSISLTRQGFLISNYIISELV